jgi:preprotein translocase subunit SecG
MINILLIIISILLIAVVIIQNSKGGGLDSNFSSQQNMLGVKKSTEVVEKATWILVGVLVCVCIFSTKLDTTGNTPVKRGESATENAAKGIETQTEETAPPLDLDTESDN